MSDIREEKKTKTYYSGEKVYMCPLKNEIKTIPAGIIYIRIYGFCRMKTFSAKKSPVFLDSLFLFYKTVFEKGEFDSSKNNFFIENIVMLFFETSRLNCIVLLWHIVLQRLQLGSCCFCAFSWLDTLTRL